MTSFASHHLNHVSAAVNIALREIQCRHNVFGRTFRIVWLLLGYFLPTTVAAAAAAARQSYDGACGRCVDVSYVSRTITSPIYVHCMIATRNPNPQPSLLICLRRRCNPRKLPYFTTF